MNNNGTFPNEENKQWAEKCPTCGEEFIKHRGGPQCQISCSALTLQNQHERILPEMVDYTLPQYQIKVEIPTDLHQYFGYIGLSNAFSQPPWLKIPWYTLRMKRKFFNTVAHELGHISSIHAKNKTGNIWLTSSVRRTARKWNYWVERDKFPFRKIRNFKSRNRNKLNYFFSEWQKTDPPGHQEDTWYQESIRLHNKLMTSSYSSYNYYNLPLDPYKREIGFDWD